MSSESVISSGRIGAMLATLVLTACTATIQDVCEHRDGANHKVGEVSSAHLGQVILDRFQYTAAPVRVPVEPIPPTDGRRAVPAGYRLTARLVDGELAYCTALNWSFACFYDTAGKGVFDQFRVARFGLAGGRQPLVPAVDYEFGEGRAISGFKSELVYLGLEDRVLYISYRDYTEDLIQPNYEQVLQVPLDEDGHGDISFRAARIQILDADPENLHYRIVSPFAGG